MIKELLAMKPVTFRVFSICPNKGILMLIIQRQKSREQGKFWLTIDGGDDSAWLRISTGSFYRRKLKILLIINRIKYILLNRIFY